MLFMVAGAVSVACLYVSVLCFCLFASLARFVTYCASGCSWFPLCCNACVVVLWVSRCAGVVVAFLVYVCCLVYALRCYVFVFGGLACLCLTLCAHVCM